MGCKATKVSIVGCGNVGMTAAYSMLHHGGIDELLLVGRDREKLIGEELDLEHGMSFLHPVKVRSTDDYKDIAGSDVIVITAGAAQKPGETRLELTAKNSRIIEDIMLEIVKYAPGAIVLIVSNPVDVLTYRAYRVAGWPKGRIFGSGTTLDTARFRFHLSEFLKVHPKSIHAYILGEHGDNSFPALSGATVGGQPLSAFPEFSEDKARKAYELARTAAYKIIASKGSTFYAIGVVISHIVSAILNNSRSVLPVSIPLHNYFGISGIALSVPCIVGREGVTQTLQTKLNWEEKQQLEKAAKTLKQYLIV
ncbi:L-lactate dehydrogenase [Candidatus Woesebacteria bacterium]|nr:L-lactate dehydrogenase [Candidatus Woesebacteria bacterium]